MFKAFDLNENTLLRKSWVSTPEALASGIARGFDDMFAFDRLQPKAAGLVIDTGYDIAFHSALRFDLRTRQWTEPEESRRRTHAHELGRIRLWTCRILEEFRSGDRIFVFKCRHGATEAQAADLLAAMNAYGPNRLLVVNIASPRCPAGAVRVIGEGLYMGAVPRFAPASALDQCDRPSWIALLRTTLELDHSYRLAGVSWTPRA